MISLRDVVTGFGNRDPLAEVWRRSLRGGGGGSAVITGVPPLRYIGDGRPLTDYLLSGNTVQDGTPSPEDPVDATGSGVRTGNVMPAGGQKTVVSNGVTFSSDGNGRYRIHGTSTEYASARFYLASGFTAPISVSNNGQGTLSFFNTGENAKVMIVFYNGTTKVDYWGMSSQNRTSTAYNAIGNKYVDNVLITVSSGETVDMIITPEFTNDGVLPNEFEPYGFKLPLTVNGTEYPIYLGTVPTTRRVKKLVLTGEESWNEITSGENTFRGTTRLAENNLNYAPGFCTHVQYVTTGVSQDLELVGCLNGNIYLRFSRAIANTIADFKSYLASQYANGTPVTVWYVLDVPTEVPPSEITIKGGISSV